MMGSRLAVVRWPLVPILVAAMTTPFDARGQTQTSTTPQSEVHEVDQIVVTGSRTERRLADTPVSTEVITREEVEASGAENLADLLEEHPGLDVFRSFAGSGIRMQGMDPEYVLVLVDGQRVTGRVGGAIDLTRFPIEDIERVEIVKGASSALYGSDALGGVVNIITRRARKRYEAEGHVAYGSFNTADVSGRGGLKLGAWNSRLSAGWHRGDGFDLNPTDIATNGNAFNEVNVGNRTEYRPDDAVTLSAHADFLYRDQSGIDLSGGGAIFERRNRTEAFSASLGPEIRMSGPSKLRATAYYMFFRDQFLLNQRGSSTLDQYQETCEQLLQLSTQYDRLLFSRHLMTVGAEGFVERLRSERLEHGHGGRERGALFAQDEWTILEKPRLVVVPGARVDFDSQFGTHPSPKIALRFDRHETLVLRASYGWGFRAPSFKELLLRFQNPGAGYVVEGNPDLRPETSRSFNVGAEYRPAKWFWLNVNFFRNDIDDLIQTEIVDGGGAGGPTQFRYVNISSAYTQGLESTVRVRPVRGLTFELGYTLTDTKDRNAQRPLAGRALHRGTFNVRYRHAPWGLEGLVRGSVVSDRPFYRDDNGDGLDERIDAPLYGTLDVRLAKSFFEERLAFFVMGENLLNAGDPQFLAIQPRTFSGGVTGRY